MSYGNQQQFDRRDRRFPTDQHGRHYFSNVEKGTGHPIGAPAPIIDPRFHAEVRGAEKALEYSEWLRSHQMWPFAPVIPPINYIEVHPVDSGMVLVNYDRWELDIQNEWKEWESRLTDTAKIHYKDEALRILESGKLPPRLLELVGPKPIDLRIIRACKQGKSRWILGLPDNDGAPVPSPAWAAELFPRPIARKQENEFTDDGELFGDEEEEAYEGEPETLEAAAPTDRMAAARAARKPRQTVGAS